MRVVLDTNVFISGIFWQGDSHKIIQDWRDNKFRLITSKATTAEITRVLRDFKIKLSDELTAEWLRIIMDNSDVVEPNERINAVKDDPSDNIFLEVAIAGNANYLISQDKHLLKIKVFRGIEILTPKEFLFLTARPRQN